MLSGEGNTQETKEHMKVLNYSGNQKMKMGQYRA